MNENLAWAKALADVTEQRDAVLACLRWVAGRTEGALDFAEDTPHGPVEAAFYRAVLEEIADEAERALETPEEGTR